MLVITGFGLGLLLDISNNFTIEYGAEYNVSNPAGVSVHYVTLPLSFSTKVLSVLSSISRTSAIARVTNFSTVSTIAVSFTEQIAGVNDIFNWIAIGY